MNLAQLNDGMGLKLSLKHFLIVALFALTLTFQNCGKLTNSPGNGQGYEGVKLPDGSSSGTGTGGTPQGGNQNTPPPAPAPNPNPAPAPAPAATPTPPDVASIQLSSQTSNLTESPGVMWPRTAYAYFQQYQVAIFSFPSMVQVNGWTNTGENKTQWFNLGLGERQQYVAGIRILGTTSTGPVSYSLPWTAYAPSSPGGVELGSGGM